MKQGKFIFNEKETCKKYEKAWSHDNNNSFLNQQAPEGGIALFTKTFELDVYDKVTLNATALGIFEIYINGNRVGDVRQNETVYDELKPGWTDYRFRVFEFVYDVTPYVKKGENRIVACVSKGWWSGRISFGAYGYRQTAVCAEVVSGKAGEEKVVCATDESWLTTLGGPILAADIYDGEYYDARITPAYACADGFDWEGVKLCSGFELPEIVEQMGPPIRERKNLFLSPISATVYEGTVDNGSDFGKIDVKRVRVGKGCEKEYLKSGEVMILDFGQNQVGRPEIVIKAKEGTRVKGHFSELLNDSGRLDRGNDGPEGALYVANYRSARAKLNYIANGSGEETYKPLYTFYGYRYFMLEAEGDVEILSVKACVVGSDIRETGSITTSNAEVNKLISNILWGQRSNYLSVPTDCPQRDERLGWTGDTQIFCQAGAYNGEILEFMRKWMTDMRDSQKICDGFCDVIPKVFGNKMKIGGQAFDPDKDAAGAAWGDAAIIVPYKMWLMYGDKSIIEENYDSLEIYMNMLSKYGMRGPVARYGDWLNYDVTPKEYISICYYYYDAALMKKFSSLLGKKDRRDHYSNLMQQIKEAYIEKYMENGEFVVQTQTGYLLPIYFGMLDGDLKKKAVKELRGKIIDNDYTLSTGFVGTGCLCQTLSECGLDDLAYSLLLQTKDPSWLYSVRQGATTVWERWNSYTKETGFGNVGMNSFNHYAYGVVLEWMYSYMAGIAPNTLKGGFKKFVLRPTPDTRKRLPKGQQPITSCKASYNSNRGMIESAWEIVEGKFEYKFTIPEGTSAKVCIPVKSKPATLNINGVDIDVSALGAVVTKGRLVFELSEGTYTVK